MDNDQQEKNYACPYKKCKAIKVQLALWARRKNFELVLVEKEWHYNTQQMSNDVKEDGLSLS